MGEPRHPVFSLDVLYIGWKLYGMFDVRKASARTQKHQKMLVCP
jgi:hypothetical protein